MTRSRFLIVFGALLICLSIGLYAKNTYTDKKSGKKAQEIVQEITSQINARQSDETATRQDDKAKAETVPAFGTEYCGILEIPEIDVVLPVSQEYSYDQMSQSLCRYSGTLTGQNMIICGHNYKSFLERLEEIFDGDSVFFTDVNGIRTEYIVVDTQMIGGDRNDLLIENNNDWDLTVFTCNYSGYSRYVIRCVQKN